MKPSTVIIASLVLLSGCGMTGDGGGVPPHASTLRLALGAEHTCALLAGGGVKCWGHGDAGQLGLGDAEDRADDAGEMGAALPFIDLGKGRVATAIAAGSAHTCAVVQGGGVKCWGRNQDGQLGLGDHRNRGDAAGEMGDALPFIDLGKGRVATAITAGWGYTCALLDGGRVKCWGRNDCGQLGLGDRRPRGGAPGEMGDALPFIDLGEGRTATAITAGYAHACALLDGGAVKCWGAGGFYGRGILGLDDSQDRGDQPGEMGDALPEIDLGTGRAAAAVTAGLLHTCALLEGGAVKCWGAGGVLGLGDEEWRGDDRGEMGDALPEVDLGGREATNVMAGFAHTCALLQGGAVTCWGLNPSGELGLGDVRPRGDRPSSMGAALPPIDLGASRSAIAVAAGDGHTCALLAGGEVKCWGRNQAAGGGGGQLGLGDTSNRGDAPGEMGDALSAVPLDGILEEEEEGSDPPLPGLSMR